MSQQNMDRYISFQGIDCDGKAHRIMNWVKQYIESPPHHSPWPEYFQAKLRNRHSLGQDDLFFVCSQINNINSLFEEYEDAKALNLLEQVEEDCC